MSRDGKGEHEEGEVRTELRHPMHRPLTRASQLKSITLIPASLLASKISVGNDLTRHIYSIYLLRRVTYQPLKLCEAYKLLSRWLSDSRFVL
jgi:hypothetical protein